MEVVTPSGNKIKNYFTIASYSDLIFFNFFSAIGAVEFLYRQKTKSNAVFSEQQTVDCLPDNFRCSGGMQHLVYDYLKTCKCGLANESSYPYSCKYRCIEIIFFLI